MVKISKFGYNLNGLNEILVSWKKTENSLSSSSFQKLIDGFKVYNQYMKYNKFKSLYYLLFYLLTLF